MNLSNVSSFLCRVFGAIFRVCVGILFALLCGFLGTIVVGLGAPEWKIGNKIGYEIGGILFFWIGVALWTYVWYRQTKKSSR